MVVVILWVLVQRVTLNRIVLDLLSTHLAVSADLVVLVITALDADVASQAFVAIWNQFRARVAVQIRNVGVDLDNRWEVICLAFESAIVVANNRLVAEFLLARHALHFSVVEDKSVWALLFQPDQAVCLVAAGAVRAVVVCDVREESSA